MELFHWIYSPLLHTISINATRRFAYCTVPRKRLMDLFFPSKPYKIYPSYKIWYINITHYDDDDSTLIHMHASYIFQLHEAARIDVIIVKHVADLVISSMTYGNVAMPIPNIVAMPVIVVTLFELMSCVFEIVIGGREVQRYFRVRPEFSPLSSPPHCLQHLVPINVPDYGYLFHL